MILVKGGAPVPAPRYTAEEYRTRYQEMHRRAQAAEGLACRLPGQLEHWKEEWARAIRLSRSDRRGAELSRREARRLSKDNDRLRSLHDPLARFIAIGKAFP